MYVLLSRLVQWVSLTGMPSFRLMINKNTEAPILRNWKIPPITYHLLSRLSRPAYQGIFANPPWEIQNIYIVFVKNLHHSSFHKRDCVLELYCKSVVVFNKLIYKQAPLGG